MYNQRTNPLYIKAKEFTGSGEMGTLKCINWIITNWYARRRILRLGWLAGHLDGRGGVLIKTV